MSKNLFDFGNYKEAYQTLQSSNLLKAKLDYEINSDKISHLNVQYKTKEKELQLVKKEQENRKVVVIASVLGISLFLGSVIFFLLQKNTKRKHY